MTDTASAIGRSGDSIPALKYVWGSGQMITVGSSHAETTAFTQSCTVTITANTNCWITVGSAPAAAASTAGNKYVPAGADFSLALGQNDKISVIQDTAGGFLSVIQAQTF